MRIRRSQDAGRLQRREDLQKRQEADDKPFEIVVQTISGGFLITLTHAIESQLTSTAAPEDAIAAPSLPTSVSSSSSSIIETTATAEDVVETIESIPVASSTSESIVSIVTSLPGAEASSSDPLPTEAATETGGPSFDSLISSFRTTTTTTSIDPLSEIATETPVVVETEEVSSGDAERVPAAGIAFGAAGGASALILGAVLALKLSRRKRGKVGGENREFKRMEGQ